MAVLMWSLIQSPSLTVKSGVISSGTVIIDSPLSKISIEAYGSLGTSSKVPDSILSLRSDKHLMCDNVLGFCPITICVIGISSGIPLKAKSI